MCCFFVYLWLENTGMASEKRYGNTLRQWIILGVLFAQVHKGSWSERKRENNTNKDINNRCVVSSLFRKNLYYCRFAKSSTKKY